MFKVMWLLKRKEGLSHHEFREHFENSHAQMGKKYYGHLWTGYRRNYVQSALGGSPAPGGGIGPTTWDYDCISEWVFRNREDYEELLRLAEDPVIGGEFLEDEGRFLDSKALILAEVEVVDTGTIA